LKFYLDRVRALGELADGGDPLGALGVGDVRGIG